jgi:hypothetical protein
VTLGDANDNAPVIEGGRTLEVSEAVAVGTVVASLTASDADSFQTVTFSVADVQHSHFNISSQGSTLQLDFVVDMFSRVLYLVHLQTLVNI